MYLKSVQASEIPKFLLCALWGFILISACSSKKEEPAPMIQPLRKTHRVIFLVLLVLLPVLFVSSIAFRHSSPEIKPGQAQPVETPR